jgi:hypothetical protein
MTALPIENLAQLPNVSKSFSMNAKNIGRRHLRLFSFFTMCKIPRAFYPNAQNKTSYISHFRDIRNENARLPISYDSEFQTDWSHVMPELPSGTTVIGFVAPVHPVPNSSRLDQW